LYQVFHGRCVCPAFHTVDGLESSRHLL
jgi:hypothetical protein